MEASQILQDTVVIYHGFCTDGFGAAYAAWKKFGNLATYIPRNRTELPFNPLVFKNKDVYVVDYSFSLEEMLSYQAEAKSFVVIDHHLSAQKDIESLDNFVFNNNHSGSYLTWQYFHPNTEVPVFIKYISDADIWAHALPDWKEIESFIYSKCASPLLEIESFIYSNGEAHFSFEHFEDLHQTLETKEGYERAKEVGGMLVGAHTEKVEMYRDMAELIEFEGYTIYAVNAPREVRSDLGHVLASKTNSFAMIFTYEKGLWKCSLRSVKDFDVSVIASKYGGGGHKNAAAFGIPTDFPLNFASFKIK